MRGNTASFVEENASFAVSGTDKFVLGHYPENPIYPGVLTAASLSDVAVSLTSRLLGTASRATEIRRARYLEPIVPGDVLRLHAELVAERDGMLQVAATASVDTVTKARATFFCQASTLPLATPTLVSDTTRAGAMRLSHQELLRILPHRYPFVMLDVVDDYAPGERICARKLASRVRSWCGAAVDSYPHSLVIESVAQAGVVLFRLSSGDCGPCEVLLVSLSEVLLLADIPFHSMLSIRVVLDGRIDNGFVARGEVYVGSELVLSIGSLCAIVHERQGRE